MTAQPLKNETGIEASTVTPSFNHHREMTRRSHLTARQDSGRENKNQLEECEITSDGCAAEIKKKEGKE